MMLWMTLVLALSLVYRVNAQNITGSGNIINSGIIKVKGTANGIPASLGGQFEMNGLAQIVPARSYQDLALTSPAVTTKQAAGNITVSGMLTVGSTVHLSVPTDSVVTLGIVSGRLTEQGYISGKISKSVDLAGATTSSDFGGIGVSISWAGTSPGMTTITRTSGTAIAVSGRTSIKRFYDVSAATNSKANVTFAYATDELQGQDPSTLDLWRLPAGETQWRRQRVTRAGNTLTRLSATAGGRFTAADTSNALSPVTKFEYEADVIASVGVDSSRGTPGNLADSLFVARIVDAFGQPVSGVQVDFTITSKPAGSTTELLTVAGGLTGADGTIATQLRLGESNGRYVVTASAPLEPGVPPREWVGYTESSVFALTKFSGDGQSDTVRAVLTTPLAVRLTDEFSAVVAGSPVRFRIISTPVGGENAMLSDTLASSDGTGVAATGMVLGSKVGTYVVEARSLDADSLATTFAVTATHGAPNGFTVLAAAQQDTVLRVLTAFAVTAVDVGGNPVPGISVRFAIVASPPFATGQGLSDTLAVTDSLGAASTVLTLGNRSGAYIVHATSDTLPGATQVLTGTAVPAMPAALALERGASQRKRIQQAVDTALAVRVLDAHGNSVPNAVVRFALALAPTGATGQSFAAADTTDSLGVARTPFTVGTKVGRYVLQATLDSVATPAVNFEIIGTNGPAASFAFVTASAQGVVKSTTAPLSVVLLDAQANPVPNAMVRFAIAGAPFGAAGQSLSADSVATDSAGIASVSLTLGDRTGLYSLIAQTSAFSGATPSVTVTATPAAVAQLVGLQGASQRKAILTLADSAFVVRVLDSLGNAVEGVPVEFAIVSTPAGAAQQQLTQAVDTSDAAGLANSRLQLGTKIGHYVVSANTPSLTGAQVLFDVLATHGAASNLLTAAPVTQDTVARQLTPFTVAVVDGFDNPIPNATVRFALAGVPSGASGQALDAAVATTDSSGQAMVRLTLGDKVGTYDVTAVADAMPSTVRTFTATAIAAGAALMARQDGDGQQQQILSSLGNAFVSRVADRFGNPVAGVPVRFAVVDTPGSATGQFLSRAVDTTDALGQASSTLRLGLKVGAYIVEADAAGLPPVRFTAVATPGAPTTIAGAVTDSIAFVATETAPFVVTVLDTGANLVPSATVAFSIIQAPAGASGMALTVTTGVTDSLGRVATSLRVGDIAGRYTVQAEITGVPPVLFAVEARALIGNANLDLRIDIGDLTAIIDHMLGRSILTGPQFRAADVDSNNVVDVRDALIARNYLLSTGTWNLADTVLNPVEFTAVREDRATGVSAGRSGAFNDAMAVGDPANTFAVLEHTSVGVRVNLTNDVPVKGIQVYLRLKQPVTSLDRDVRFARARNMDIFITGNDREVRAVVYNFQNLPVDSGFGPVFRIPIPGLDTTQVDSVAIIVSTGDGNTSTLIDQQQVTKTVGQYPTTFALYQNYPNPFNNETTIEYEVPEIAGRIPRVAIQIFNVIGEKVRTIDRQDRDAGRYIVRWNGRDDNGATVATGVYFYRLLSVDPVEGNHFATTKKMIMVK
jgi:hypothetical protein